MGSPIIGIDLGTANSVVAVMAESRPTVISNPQGTATTPSVVGFTARGERLVGHPAKNQLLANPKNTVFGVKRFMGRRMREVGEEERHLPYELKGNPDDLLRVAVGDGSYTPQEISAMILAELKLQAEEYLGQRVERAVITVPAYFNDAQRQATKDAGEIAGLKVERIINEATAAALTYGRGRKTEHKIAVFDLGGGTFNVSILEVGEGVFEVLATDGDPNVGGDAFTEAMRRAWAQSVEEKLGRPLVLDACTWHSIRQELELPKQHLSELAAVDVPVPRCLSWRRDLDLPAVTVTRQRLEDHYERLKHGIRSTCERALADARVRSSDIAEVVLVGGSTRIPGVQALARAVFPACTLFRGVNPDEVVAQGAAIGAGVLAGDVKDVVLLDVNTKTVGIRVHGGEMVVLIPRNATIPTSKKEFLCTTRDNQATATISVFQGDHPRAEENTLLGSIRLEGLGAAAAGEQRVEVEFSLDQNGILSVKATDKATGKAQEIKITGSSGLSKDEVERMRRDAEEHAAADTVRRELVDTKNRAEQVAYQVKKQLEEMGAKVPQDVRTKLEGAVSNLEERVKGDDKAAIEAALNNLMNAAGELR